MAVVFVAAEMSGAGMMAFPRALARSGWLGASFLVLYCVNAALSGILLGRSWLILEERWPRYKLGVGNPYPAIGERAVGPWVKAPVSVLSHFTLLGTAVVFVLLISQFMSQMFPEVSHCAWILILAAVLLPFSFIRAPHDFWFMALAALASTLAAETLALLVMWRDVRLPDYVPPAPRALDFQAFFLALSTFSFACGGCSTFPSFQNDMKNRDAFPKAVAIAYAILLSMFLAVGVPGYLAYGDRATDNILETIGPGPLRTAAQALLILHLFSAFQIIINTPCQEYEQLLDVPRRFTWKRVAVRTLVMCVITFVCLSIREFGKILNLVGAVAANTTTFVFPPLFYLLLCGQRSPDWTDRSLPMWAKLYLWGVVWVGLVSGAIGSYAALDAIADFSPPCYLQL